EVPEIVLVSDNAGNFTGPLANGDVTDDSTPTLTGTAEAGSVVHVYDNGREIGTARTDAQGNWTFTPRVALDLGTHTLTVTAEDAAGNESALSDAFELTLDVGGVPSAPAITNVIDDAGSKTGPLQSGDVTDDTTPTLTGTAQAGSIIHLYNNGTEIGTTTSDAQGRWTFTPDVALSDGDYSITVIAESSSGNMSPETGAFEFTVDSTSPVPGPIQGVAGDNDYVVLMGEFADPSHDSYTFNEATGYPNHVKGVTSPYIPNTASFGEYADVILMDEATGVMTHVNVSLPQNSSYEYSAPDGMVIVSWDFAADITTGTNATQYRYSEPEFEYVLPDSGNETIAASNDSLTLESDDVLSHSDVDLFRADGSEQALVNETEGAFNGVSNTEDWSTTGQTVVDSESYNVYTSAEQNDLLIQQVVSMQIM
ncbi:hypothetical protein L8909_004221, partial [Salmonella enterica]|nr:hypothetical protein [Salmonella enterica]